MLMIFVKEYVGVWMMNPVFNKISNNTDDIVSSVLDQIEQSIITKVDYTIETPCGRMVHRQVLIEIAYTLDATYGTYAIHG